MKPAFKVVIPTREFFLNHREALTKAHICGFCSDTLASLYTNMLTNQLYEGLPLEERAFVVDVLSPAVESMLERSPHDHNKRVRTLFSSTTEIRRFCRQIASLLYQLHLFVMPVMDSYIHELITHRQSNRCDFRHGGWIGDDLIIELWSDKIWAEATSTI